ncbi:geranylgeranyl hydrogenase [Candidatus Bathyarchaeota archaeon B24-2]|nr:MAG: geranylgeranyl hydrogenase [Candidatus Bathyarchaeota archaeon B24-2]
MVRFDVIVVGAGTAGCLAASSAAEEGLNVCLIDVKSKEDIGRKVCGDAIGKHHFDNLGLKYPSGEELERKVEGVFIYSPDRKSVFEVKGEGLHGFVVNRHLFGQRLLKKALEAGADLHDSTRVVKPLIKNGVVIGVKAKKGSQVEDLYASIVIDASGMNAVIRRNLPPELGIEKEPEKEDVIACYREIRVLREQLPEPEYLRIYLNSQVAPGGYYWIFPEGENKVNVGLGVAMRKGFPNPKAQLYKYVLSQPLFEGSRVIHGGGGLVPTRRPLDRMVSDGLMLVGDVAFQVNPLHGGGIGPSMMAGRIAGKVAAEALEEGDVSTEGLWRYGVEYIREYGAKQAGLDVFRTFLQKLSDEELNYGMRNKLITEEDVLITSMGDELKLNLTEKIVRLFRNLGKIDLIMRLRKLVDLMNEIRDHYRVYPSSLTGLASWKTKALEIMERAKAI